MSYCCSSARWPHFSLRRRGLKATPISGYSGQWSETIDSEKYKRARPEARSKERLVFFFRDGTGVVQVAYSDTGHDNAFSFTWVLSEDGTLIKTEDRQGKVYVARVTTVSDTALRIKGTSHVNGTFVRVRR